MRLFFEESWRVGASVLVAAMAPVVVVRTLMAPPVQPVPAMVPAMAVVAVTAMVAPSTLMAVVMMMVSGTVVMVVLITPMLHGRDQGFRGDLDGLGEGRSGLRDRHGGEATGEGQGGDQGPGARHRSESVLGHGNLPVSFARRQSAMMIQDKKVSLNTV